MTKIKIFIDKAEYTPYVFNEFEAYGDKYGNKSIEIDKKVWNRYLKVSRETYKIQEKFLRLAKIK